LKVFKLELIFVFSGLIVGCFEVMINWGIYGVSYVFLGGEGLEMDRKGGNLFFWSHDVAGAKSVNDTSSQLFIK